MSRLRGTGRTTRMINAAIEAAQQGNHVLICCATHAHAQNLRRLTRPMVDEVTFDRLHFQGKDGAITGRPADMIFMDHWAVEKEIQDIRQIVGMLHSRLSILQDRVIT